ncbi:hypothetical protein [Xanthomonas sp. 3058]|uniref:hypothetical protein n=1 Tax=Xanthomonas sp. 3058 TaxID=3035314 RepID=UPI001613EE6E|nr:hypothetical protein [Xanthomonas sp. 3058]MBB5862892.1 hypothetical protein [Xanthomonas sp. 3058]
MLKTPKRIYVRALSLPSQAGLRAKVRGLLFDTDAAHRVRAFARAQREYAYGLNVAPGKPPAVSVTRMLASQRTLLG